MRRHLSSLKMSCLQSHAWHSERWSEMTFCQHRSGDCNAFQKLFWLIKHVPLDSISYRRINNWLLNSHCNYSWDYPWTVGLKLNKALKCKMQSRLNPLTSSSILTNPNYIVNPFLKNSNPTAIMSTSGCKNQPFPRIFKGLLERKWQQNNSGALGFYDLYHK